MVTLRVSAQMRRRNWSLAHSAEVLRRLAVLPADLTRGRFIHNPNVFPVLLSTRV